MFVESDTSHHLQIHWMQNTFLARDSIEIVWHNEILEDHHVKALTQTHPSRSPSRLIHSSIFPSRPFDGPGWICWACCIRLFRNIAAILENEKKPTCFNSSLMEIRDEILQSRMQLISRGIWRQPLVFIISDPPCEVTGILLSYLISRVLISNGRAAVQTDTLPGSNCFQSLYFFASQYGWLISCHFTNYFSSLLLNGKVNSFHPVTMIHVFHDPVSKDWACVDNTDGVFGALLWWCIMFLDAWV